jgi:hypothetical protein
MAARGAQRPDGIGGQSLPFQLRGFIGQPASGTNGTSFMQIVANPLYCYLTTASYAANSWTMNASGIATPFAPTLLSSVYINQIRIVSWGVITRCIMNANVAQGYIVEQTTASPLYSQVVPGDQLTGDTMSVTGMAPGATVTFIGKPVGVTANSFRPYTFYQNNQYDLDWTSLTIETPGVPVTSAIPLLLHEVVFNLELTVLETSGYGMFSRPAPVRNGPALAIADRIQGSSKSLYNGTVDYVTAEIDKLANTTLKDALSAGLRFIESVD